VKDKKRKTRGSTMVEVIVAFAVLMIVLACFAEITGLCLQMAKRSSEARRRNEALYQAYYTDTNRSNGAQLYNGGLAFRQGDAAGFTLNVDLREKSYPDGSVYYFYGNP
jgi:Tfp pilus assembly protein PilV